MKNLQSQTNSMGNLKTVKRKVVSASPEKLIETDYLHPDWSLPLVVRPAVKGVNLLTWASGNQDFIEAQLIKHGAILFRNFDINSVAEFEEFIAAICGEALEYRYRASPRSQVSGRIYTSTDYPADQSIFPHNEHAYSPVFPGKIFFYCVTPAESGGETPIGSTRKIFERIDRKIRDRFIEKKVMYVRNFGDGFGLPWQTVFQTTEPADVEKYCRSHGIEFEWKEGGKLRTRQVSPVVIKHPRTGETVWFNHATFFHVSTLPAAIRDSLLAEFKEDDLPTNTFYGDGSTIEASVLQQLRDAYLQEMVSFFWQKSDILMLDNLLSVHARNPYTGSRKVVVGMAEPLSHIDITHVSHQEAEPLKSSSQIQPGN
ncbi:TauD/TfdA family dioxygenase [Aerosakkonema sp. BLCC-F183]|uniref:TauD/TfdA family dioxygenase n=1 Tax=Aerosakkonema sp. BLCC-F183 TaxID=3342834 RepID=UPI0035B7728D